ncbi:hypothetical protein [Pseudoclavibacter sp. VKM Ac-2888]|uniref:hypothetical protein n=1 Tax=Pseudoclavibacter sp. VKM Ac-2888 TaxID=2783830 RepID=UPI00188D84C0|nr:hypothetical protein [Pseudoclavibacter sp. VKM Ac-2888]MBF4549490.1 hypothetical protein [Pseudoclavibacter sp. VKM Ac-2888]
MAESWTDRQGDVWTLGDDGLLHTPETAPFPREYVERKWGPLVLFEVTPTPEPRAEAMAVLARAGAVCGQCGREPSDPIDECDDCAEVLARYADALLDAGIIRRFTEQFAIQEKTFLDGEYDRLDTGAGWSNRRGRRYTEAEAHARAERQSNLSRSIPTRVMRRFVTEYEPVDAG